MNHEARNLRSISIRRRSNTCCSLCQKKGFVLHYHERFGTSVYASTAATGCGSGGSQESVADTNTTNTVRTRAEAGAYFRVQPGNVSEHIPVMFDKGQMSFQHGLDGCVLPILHAFPRAWEYLAFQWKGKHCTSRGHSPFRHQVSTVRLLNDHHSDCELLAFVADKAGGLLG
jgi:hypothetical protein